MGSIADKSINDVKANAERVVEDVKDSVEETVENVEARVDRLSTVKKAVVAAGAVVVTYSVVSGLVKRFLARNDVTVELAEDEEVIVVTEDQVL